MFVVLASLMTILNGINIVLALTEGRVSVTTGVIAMATTIAWAWTAAINDRRAKI